MILLGRVLEPPVDPILLADMFFNEDGVILTDKLGPMAESISDD